MLRHLCKSSATQGDMRQKESVALLGFSSTASINNNTNTCKCMDGYCTPLKKDEHIAKDSNINPCERPSGCLNLSIITVESKTCTVKAFTLLLPLQIYTCST